MSDPLYRQSAAGYAVAAPSDKSTVVVVYGLYLAGYLTAGLTTLIGLVMTYALRGEASEVARSHYVFLARTFWLGLAWSLAAALAAILGVVFAITIIGIPLAVLLFLFAKLAGVLALIWYGVRCVLGLMAALGDRAYGAPRSWLI